MSGNSASQSRPIFLVGMMGSGKSTVGPRLADRLGRRFVDTDEEVERADGRRIAQIFAQDGEARFRALEAAAIERVAGTDAIVALGGGAIAQPGAAERLRARGLVVFLRADPETLVDRIGDGATRPLLAGLGRAAQVERLADLLAERLEYYQSATLSVDASRSAEEVVDEIVSALETEPHRAARERGVGRCG